MENIKSHRSNFFIDLRYRSLRYLLLLSGLYIVIFLTYLSNYGGYIDIKDCLLISMFLLICYFLLFITHIKILIPRFLLTGKNGWYLVLLTITILFITTIQIYVSYLVEEQYGIPHPQFHSRTGYILYTVVSFLLNGFLFCGLSVTILLQQWIIQSRAISGLNKQKLNTELNILKQKIQPEFLFNILNKANVLTVTKPLAASEMLLKLSNVLRYQLYDSNREKVLLKSDIAFTRNYLELEHMRTPTFSYTLIHDKETEKIFIPPLLFIPLIDKALHYFYLHENNYSSVLQLHYSIEREKLVFTCIISQFESEIFLSFKHPDVYQRFDLLYGTKYSIARMEEAGNYIIKTSIPLYE